MPTDRLPSPGAGGELRRQLEEVRAALLTLRLLCHLRERRARSRLGRPRLRRALGGVAGHRDAHRVELGSVPIEVGEKVGVARPGSPEVLLERHGRGHELHLLIHEGRRHGGEDRLAGERRRAPAGVARVLARCGLQDLAHHLADLVGVRRACLVQLGLRHLDVAPRRQLRDQLVLDPEVEVGGRVRRGRRRVMVGVLALAGPGDGRQHLLAVRSEKGLRIGVALVRRAGGDGAQVRIQRLLADRRAVDHDRVRGHGQRRRGDGAGEGDEQEQEPLHCAAHSTR